MEALNRPGDDHVVVCRGLVKTYDPDSRDASPVLAGVDMEVAKGESVAEAVSSILNIHNALCVPHTVIRAPHPQFGEGRPLDLHGRSVTRNVDCLAAYRARGCSGRMAQGRAQPSQRAHQYVYGRNERIRRR